MTAPIQLFPDEGSPPVEEPNKTEIMPSPSSPLAVARVLLAERTEGQTALIRHWRGGWMQYTGTHWTEEEEKLVRKWVYTRLEHVMYVKGQDKEGNEVLAPWAPNRNTVTNVLDAVMSIAALPQTVETPSWLHSGRPANGVVACLNGLVDVTTQRITKSTPDYFGLTCIPLDYNPDAGPPVQWLRFLNSVWPSTDGKTPEEIRALQQWFGYVLSGRTDLQKILLMVGQKRSGKGTIARVLRALVGARNAVAPTLGDLGNTFGMQGLIGKSLAVVGDARIDGQGNRAVVERLLSISGEDAITVPRKNRDDWDGKLGARFMVLSNELPRFSDASGAIASRFVILTLRESFLGREDIDLEGRLMAELPAILQWGLDGLADLNKERRITEPAASRESVQMLVDLVSPIGAFVREVLIEEKDEMVETKALYRQYEAWCGENGRSAGSVQKWSSDLHSVLPYVRTDFRPKVNGKAQPRCTTGVKLNPEWVTREREEHDGWRMAS
jgi:putative DNA primase/helicase